MGKDFHAAFSNMNKAVRPGVGQPDVEKKKLTQAEKRKTMHGVQTYLSDEEYELLMLTKIKTKKTCEDINERLHGPYGGRDKLCIPPDLSPVLSSHG